MVQQTLRQRKEQAARPRRVESWRLWAMMIFFTAFALYNAKTVFSLQVLQGTDLAAKAEERIRRKDTIDPRRGSIYDSQGLLLAGNTTAEDIYVDKSNIKTDEKLRTVTDLLAPVIGRNAGDLFTQLKEAPSIYVKVASRVNDDMAIAVRDVISNNRKTLLFKISMEPRPLRQYPSETLAASVIGFTDYDNQGHYGVEEFYNAKLAGEAGWIDAERDAEGRALVMQKPEMQPAVDGSDLVLTIDNAIQHLAERELDRSLKEFQAERGYVLVQDPNTGAILAMANWPTFNPNLFGKIEDYSLFKNPMVNDVREPGSTMKILTYASSMDAGAITPDTVCPCENSYIIKYGSRMNNATGVAYTGQTMTLGLGRSDNVASMFAAERLGEQGFFEYVKNFGIGSRTGIDLAGEVAGLLWYPGDENYSPINLYTNSFGQGVATTPIQLVNAVSAVANGGTLMKPYVMKEIRKDGLVVERTEPQEIRRVLKTETAKQISDMLAYGVENKLVARFSRVPGYHVSVKTGTAQIVENGVYISDGSFASAIGYAPSQDAKFTLLIGILNPRTSQWGENTASLSWGRLAKELLLYMDAQPTEPLPTATPVP